MEGAGGQVILDVKEDRRRREMVVRGFKRNTPKAEVVKKMKELVTEAEVSADGLPFTIGPLVSFGLVRFFDLEEKAKFKQWLSDNMTRMKNEGIWVSDNVDKENLLKEVVTGKLKKAICISVEGLGDGGSKEVVADYRRGQVFLGGGGKWELVGQWEESRMVLLTEEVGTLKGKVEQMIKDEAYLDNITLTIRTK